MKKFIRIYILFVFVLIADKSYSQSILHDSLSICSEVNLCKNIIKLLHFEIDSLENVIKNKIDNSESVQALLLEQNHFESGLDFLDRISRETKIIDSWIEFEKINQKKQELHAIQMQIFETKDVLITLDTDNYNANDEKWYFEFIRDSSVIYTDTLDIKPEDAKYLYQNFSKMTLIGLLNFEVGDDVSLIGFSIEDDNIKLAYHFQQLALFDRININVLNKEFWHLNSHSFIVEGSRILPRSFLLSDDNNQIAITQTIYPPNPLPQGSSCLESTLDRHAVCIYNFNTEKVYFPTDSTGYHSDYYYHSANKMFFSPDGNFLIICQFIQYHDYIHVIDLSNEKTFTLELPYGVSGLTNIFFSPDSKLFAIGGDRTNYSTYDASDTLWGDFINVFDFNGSSIRFLSEESVSDIRFSKYGNFLLLNSSEIYNLSNQKKIDTDASAYAHMFNHSYYDIIQAKRFEPVSPTNRELKFHRLNKISNIDRIQIEYKTSKDCYGDFAGKAIIDPCGDCVEGNTKKVSCVQDCHGDYGGDAFIDDCGNCVSGNTGQLKCLKGWFDNGQLKLEIRYYPNGLPNSEMHYYKSGVLALDMVYHQNGMLSSELSYNQSSVLVNKKEYYKSGVLALDMIYHENGMLSSEMSYNNESVLVTTKEYYESGVLSDDIHYYDSGHLKSEITYNSEGSLHGVIKTWYPNKQVESQFFYDDGLLENGTHGKWREDGALKYMIEFSNDSKKGKGVEYDPKGKKNRKFKVDRLHNEI